MKIRSARSCGNRCREDRPVTLHAQAATPVALAKERPLPRLVKKDGRYALFVDGAPYLILGAQVHNSSAWPAMLPKVWPAMEYLNVNTVEIPVYWEQFEPRQGQYDHTRDRHAPGRGSPAQRSPGSALVRHLEERQPALHAGVDETGPGPLPAPDGQERAPRGLAFALRRRVARSGQDRVHRVHAPPEGGRPAAHGDHGASGERTRHLGQPARLLSRPRRSSSKRPVPADVLAAMQVKPAPHRRTGRKPLAPKPKSTSTPGR